MINRYQFHQIGLRICEFVVKMRCYRCVYIDEWTTSISRRKKEIAARRRAECLTDLTVYC